MSAMVKGNNPIIWSDFPDVDIIRVDDTYYMVSTTMHFMPGAVILRSYDLINWEIASYVYDKLEENASHTLKDGKGIYGKGMWAASLRYHNGEFYVFFVANDTQKTYLYRSKSVEGPWIRSEIEGFYHDCSLLFDDDGRVYIIYGNTDIYLTELEKNLSKPKKDGLHKIIITEKDHVGLGYEGAHFYKINQKYYVFLIHWLAYGNKRRVEACYVSDSVDGEYTGRNVLDDDLGYLNAGVAQGGIVDTPDGEWYAMLFQDHGAVGRIPVLVPVSWKDDFPILGYDGKVPLTLETKSTKPGYVYAPVVSSDDFSYQADESGKVQLKNVWQWNHNPNDSCWSLTEKKGCLRLYTDKVSKHIFEASNVLTQHTMGPECAGIVTIDGSNMNIGDVAGISAFQGCYGFAALTREEDGYYVVMVGREKGDESLSGKEYDRIKLASHTVTLKVQFDFRNNIDTADFYYQPKGDNQSGTEFIKIGATQHLFFMLDHFVGCRLALFLYSKEKQGKYVEFSNFIYEMI